MLTKKLIFGETASGKSTLFANQKIIDSLDSDERVIYIQPHSRQVLFPSLANVRLITDKFELNELDKHKYIVINVPSDGIFEYDDCTKRIIESINAHTSSRVHLIVDEAPQIAMELNHQLNVFLQDSILNTRVDFMVLTICTDIFHSKDISENKQLFNEFFNCRNGIPLNEIYFLRNKELSISGAFDDFFLSHSFAKKLSSLPRCKITNHGDYLNFKAYFYRFDPEKLKFLKHKITRTYHRGLFTPRPPWLKVPKGKASI